MTDRLLPLWELTRARLLEFFREPGVIFWVFGFPVLLAIALGVAFRNRPPEATPVAVIEEAGSEDGAWLAGVLEESGRLDPVLLPREEAEEAVRRGEAELAVLLDGPRTSPEPPAEAPARAGPAGEAPRPVLHLLYDPDRPGVASAALAVEDAVQRALGRGDPAVLRTREVSERGGRYIDFLLPGLIGLNLMGSSMWGVGFAIVQTRVGKLLKRFAASPMRRSDYLLSLMLSRLVFLAAELVFLLAAGYLIFGVTVQGSWAALGAVSLLGAVSFTGLALLVAARPTSVEAASGWMNFVMLPMWVVSGSFFSYSRFPEALHPAIRALPLTALNDALRAVMNEGAPLAASWLEIGVLAAWGIAGFLLALRIFRWQ
jgi:ABC-type multidrug transport system permease subunit